jgi:hypothetical protein
LSRNCWTNSMSWGILSKEAANSPANKWNC